MGLSRFELVGIAERLCEIYKEGVFAWYPAGKEIQMRLEALTGLFPDGGFSVEKNMHLGEKVAVSARFCGVKFFAICTPEEIEEAKAHE